MVVTDKYVVGPLGLIFFDLSSTVCCFLVVSIHPLYNKNLVKSHRLSPSYRSASLLCA